MPRRMKRCGLTERQIAEQLQCSQAQAHILIHEGIDSYLNEAKQESKEWLNAIIAEHIKIAQEAWIQWERSKQNKERRTVKTTEDGTEETEMTEGQCGDPRQLAIVQSSMDSIAKLRKLFVDDHGQPPQDNEQEDTSDQVASMFASMLPPSVVEEYLLTESGHDSQDQEQW